MPRAKLRTPELRQEILDVAIAVLAGEGANGFTAREIAGRAGTSTSAIYELFGDKAGLLRAVYIEGFRSLRSQLARHPDSDDPRADLLAMSIAYRDFMTTNRVLGEIMFSRPFADFDPGPEELRAGTSVRTLVVRRVQRCIDAGQIAGDATDIAHAVVALVQGLAAAESAQRLGRSKASVDRRWQLAVTALIDGLEP